MHPPDPQEHNAANSSQHRHRKDYNSLAINRQGRQRWLRQVEARSGVDTVQQLLLQRLHIAVDGQFQQIHTRACTR